MILAVLLACGLLRSLVASQSYGELALTKVYPAFQSAVIGLGNFTVDSMPQDPEVKSLRKSIGVVRELLDVFVYAYPNNTGVKGDRDLFVDIRGDLDNGYESMGNFKDLYDSQAAEDEAENTEPSYDKKELQSKRQLVLDWKDKFLGQFGPKDYDTYIRTPAPDQLYRRKRRNLSRFYWKAANIEPLLSLNGIQNLQRLAGETAESAVKDFAVVAQLKNLDGDNALTFHDLRKWLRCIDLLCSLFPEILVNAPSDVTQAVSDVHNLVSSYGELHDKIVAETEAQLKGHKSKAKDLLKEIDEQWKLVKQQQLDNHIQDHLAEFGDWLMQQVSHQASQLII